MRARFIKYGKGVKRDGGNEHLEVSMELMHGESEYDALDRAKEFVNEGLRPDHSEQGKVTLGDAMKAKANNA